MVLGVKDVGTPGEGKPPIPSGIKDDRVMKLLVSVPAIEKRIIITRGDLTRGETLLESSGTGFFSALKRYEDGSVQYIVNEWEVSEREAGLIRLIIYDLMRYQDQYYELLAEGKLEEVIKMVVEKYDIQAEVRLRRDRILYYVYRDTLGFGMIQPLIYDPHITDIDIKGTDPVRVKVRQFAGRWINTNVRFPTEEDLKQFTSRIASLYGRGISEATPLVSFVYKNPEKKLRFRVAASFGGVKSEQTTVQIRKFPPKPFLFNDLIRFGSLSPEAATAIWMLVDHKGKIAYSGPVGTGKTTLLNASLAMFDPRKKLVTIEDIEELSLDFKGNSWVPYYARGGEYYEIVKFALRITPDLMILAEVLGKELGDVLASQTGHGLAFTIHANTVEEFNLRFQMLLRMYYGENVSRELLEMTIRELWALLFLDIRENKRILRNIYMLDIDTGKMIPIYTYPTTFKKIDFIRLLSRRTGIEMDKLEAEFDDRLEFINETMDMELEDLYTRLVDWYNKRW